MTKNRRQIKVVVDTNLFVSGSILKRGNPYELLEAWRRKPFVLLISEVLQTEIAEVLIRAEIKEKYHLTDKEVEDTLQLLQTNPLLTLPAPTLPVALRDPKDQKVLALAIGGEADYLVTGDEDLLTVHGNPELSGLQIVRPTALLA
ncbi:MAG: putative toxin-antitoxin system toxin component, PIN family, partial [Actinobacteria bacterium]|nr:putative toxin-antitoxin system toxin component, PIN family [Actinomycetota bacterium]